MADAGTLAVTFALARPGGFRMDVTLECARGITCVMGPSGAGKTTMLGVIAGLVAPDRGTVTLGDEPWLDLARGVARPVHERRLAYVFQGAALFPHLTAAGNVEFALPQLPRDERAAKARALLERVGAAQLAERKPRSFSGGEAQRVALARALAREPRLVLLDEPFSALDRATRNQLAALVREVAGELAVPVLHVTHSHAEAKVLADRVVVVEAGSIVAQGTPAETLTDD